MSRKKWMLLIICILLLAAYWKLFYKTYSETQVAGSADVIFALDVKRLTNTVIWNTITTPSQWKRISYSSSKRVNWKDMFKIPDYIFVFHSLGHPQNAWYTVGEVKDDEAFREGLNVYHFNTTDSLHPGEYFSDSSGIDMVRSGNKVVIGNHSIKDKNFLRQIASEIFVQQKFVSKETLLKNADAESHLSIRIAKNDFLQDDAILKFNLHKDAISFESIIKPQQRFSFRENQFFYSPAALCGMGFTQPPSTLVDMIPERTKTKISKAINFSIDSLFVAGDRNYNLNVSGILPRVDSAISYTYDDDFNPIENVVVNNVLEPSYNLDITGRGVAEIYQYWSDSGQLEKSAAGEMFLPMPFARSYCNLHSKTRLAITSAGFTTPPATDSMTCIFFFKLMITKIPNEIMKYLPANVTRTIANMEAIEIVAKKDSSQIKLRGNLKKKKNDLPIISF